MLSFSLPPLTIEIADGDVTAQVTDAVVEAGAMAQGPVEPGPPDCPVSG